MAKKEGTSAVEKRSGYEGVDIPVPYKNDLRPNQRNAKPAISGPRDVLRFAQPTQHCGDLGSPPTDFFQGIFLQHRGDDLQIPRRESQRHAPGAAAERSQGRDHAAAHQSLPGGQTHRLVRWAGSRGDT